MTLNFIYKGLVSGTSSKTNKKYYRVDYSLVTSSGFTRDYSFFLNSEEEEEKFFNYINEMNTQNIQPILLDNIINCYHSKKFNDFKFGIDINAI